MKHTLEYLANLPGTYTKHTDKQVNRIKEQIRKGKQTFTGRNIDLLSICVIKALEIIKIEDLIIKTAKDAAIEYLSEYQDQYPIEDDWSIKYWLNSVITNLEIRDIVTQGDYYWNLFESSLESEVVKICNKRLKITIHYQPLQVEYNLMDVLNAECISLKGWYAMDADAKDRVILMFTEDREVTAKNLHWETKF